MGRVFANGPEDLGSIPGHIIATTSKIILDTFLFNNQQYKLRVKGKEEQSQENSSIHHVRLVVVAFCSEPSGRLRLLSPTLLFY